MNYFIRVITFLKNFNIGLKNKPIILMAAERTHELYLKVQTRVFEKVKKKSASEQRK